MKQRLVFLVLLLAMVWLGCAANVHTIGTGPSGNNITQARQWYVLFGLVPINKVDTNAMAAGATNYQIKTEASVLDVIINIFTEYVTVMSRTVTVTK